MVTAVIESICFRTCTTMLYLYYTLRTTIIYLYWYLTIILISIRFLLYRTYKIISIRVAYIRGPRESRENILNYISRKRRAVFAQNPVYHDRPHIIITLEQCLLAAIYFSFIVRFLRVFSAIVLQRTRLCTCAALLLFLICNISTWIIYAVRICSSVIVI